MKTIFILIVFLTISSSVIKAQDLLKESINDNIPSISERFIGGEEELRKFIATNVKYPMVTAKNHTVGFSISSITISPEGNINEIEIINSVDNGVDYEINRVLSETKGYWKPVNYTSDDLTYYIQVGFQSNDYGRNFDYSFNPIKASNFMEITKVIAYFPSNSIHLKTDDYLQNKVTKSLKKEKYETALESLNEIVKRNPTESKLYQLRMTICRKLNNDSLLQSDIKKMQFFSKYETNKQDK